MQAGAALVLPDPDTLGVVPKTALSQLVSMLNSGQPTAQQRAALQLAAATAGCFNFEAILAGKVQVLSQHNSLWCILSVSRGPNATLLVPLFHAALASSALLVMQRACHT